MGEPDWSRAVIPEGKLAAYLLAIDHPEGGAKARFFLLCGFGVDTAEKLAAALRRQAVRSEVKSIQSPFGLKYIVDGPLTGLDGRERRLRSIWIVEGEDGPPRFVTAYPLEARDGDR